VRGCDSANAKCKIARREVRRCKARTLRVERYTGAPWHRRTPAPSHVRFRVLRPISKFPSTHLRSARAQHIHAAENLAPSLPLGGARRVSLADVACGQRSGSTVRRRVARRGSTGADRPAADRGPRRMLPADCRPVERAARFGGLGSCRCARSGPVLHLAMPPSQRGSSKLQRPVPTTAAWDRPPVQPRHRDERVAASGVRRTGQSPAAPCRTAGFPGYRAFFSAATLSVASHVRSLSLLPKCP